MKWSVGAKIAAGFALALVILVVIGAVSYQSTAGFSLKPTIAYEMAS